MANTVKLTAAQAVIKYMASRYVDIDGRKERLFGGVFSIFGHGNVAGIGEALWDERETLPTFRAHNEQSMAHAAIAYAKTHARRRMMACTASAGPGSTNMVTAAALAHINRLPVLFLPGDTFATRIPDPVLQQLESPQDSTLTVNDCFRPVSRYFDRITRPEQLLQSLPQAIRVLTDPAECGPVTLALPQDVQTMAYDFPLHFFDDQVISLRRPQPDARELERAVEMILESKKPLIIAGGGVHYSLAEDSLQKLAEKCHIPVAETQAGKGSLLWHSENLLGGVGVTGTTAANEIAREADLVIAIGTRLGDFTSGSRALLRPGTPVLSINVAAFDSIKHRSQALVADARVTIDTLLEKLGDWCSDESWTEQYQTERLGWKEVAEKVTAASDVQYPSDAQVIGAVDRSAEDNSIVVCAAGGLPGELHKLWRTRKSNGYHMEYGYSCMGYEIAGGLGVKMASPDDEVYVMVGDGSYLMLNSELATSVLLRKKLIIVLLDNRGYGCIHRLQGSCGMEEFNNLIDHIDGEFIPVDFASHARALGAEAETVESVAELEQALERAKLSQRTFLISIRTDPEITTPGGQWWDVAVPETSVRTSVNKVRSEYEERKRQQKDCL